MTFAGTGTAQKNMQVRLREFFTVKPILMWGEGRGREISKILRTSLAAGSLSHAGIGIFPLPLVTSSLITIRD